MIPNYRIYIIYVDEHLNILCEIMKNLKIY